MYSILDGVGTPSDYVKKAKELGMESIGITNHGNVDSVIKFQNECDKENINLIIGCELYLVQNLYKKEKGEKRNHVCVWVKNKTGWKNLLQMLTIANLEGYYYKPRIDIDTLLEHCEGLVIGTACVSTFLNQDWGLDLLTELKKKTEVFIEMMPSDFELQNETNKKLLEIADNTDTEIIATNDCHYVNKEDYEAQETLLCINSRDKWSNPNRWKFQANDFYFKTELEMTNSFKDQGILTRRQIRTSINNTEKVVDLCKDFQLKQVEIALPRVKRVKESKLTDLEYLTKLVEKGYMEKDIQNKHNKQVYDDRIKEEMELIKMKGFERYFLIVWDLIQWSESNGIMSGPGRGSAAGSLVCYLLGITKVDPIEFGLMFFRFINPARADLPDIDSDFPDNRRDDIINHLKEIYGENHVSGISTFGFLKTRSVIRDLGRVFEIDKNEIDMIAKSCDDKETFETLAKTNEGQVFARKYPQQMRIGSVLEGNIRNRGRHACGTIISEEDLTNGTKANLNIDKKSGSLICNWDKHDIEFQGLMKLDVLGLNALSVINECKSLVKQRHHKDINFNNLPLNDRKVLRRFSRGDNTGCFQLNTSGLKKFCKKLKINSFMDIVHATSLFRPGTLGNGTAEDFIKRKNNKQKWNFIHPLLEPITGYTYGIIVYQEQAMQMVHELAGLDWATTNKIRKVIAKSQGEEALMKYKEMFIKGCLEMKTLDEDTANKVFNDLASFGAYGFNLSHAVAYSHITYWDMYLKQYYPIEFYCANLNSGSSVEANKEEIILDAVENGFDVRPPKTDISEPTKWIIRKNILYAPFSEVKGYGEKGAKKLSNMNSNKLQNKKMGFFEMQTSKPLTKSEQESIALLKEIEADKDIPISKDKSYKIKKYFGYRFK